jgi:hypothetical protein
MCEPKGLASREMWKKFKITAPYCGAGIKPLSTREQSQKIETLWALLLAFLGGGTGNTVTYMGEELRMTNAEIVYMDLSRNAKSFVFINFVLKGQ